MLRVRYVRCVYVLLDACLFLCVKVCKLWFYCSVLFVLIFCDGRVGSCISWESGWWYVCFMYFFVFVFIYGSVTVDTRVYIRRIAYCFHLCVLMACVPVCLSDSNSEYMTVCLCMFVSMSCFSVCLSGCVYVCLIFVSVCLFVCLFVCVYLSVCLSVSLSIFLPVCLFIFSRTYLFNYHDIET